MYCSISREVCTEPVISKKTGHIFEKALISKHLKLTGKCPVTEEDMSLDDLIDVQGYDKPSRPRPANASSIPSLLKTFQNEWDQLMLDSYNLKKHVETVRQQLSHALYQYDAACRVIARLTQERDRALEELANTRQNMAAALAQSDNIQQMQMSSKQEVDEDTEMADKSEKKAGDGTEEESEDMMDPNLPANIRECTSMTPELVKFIENHATTLAKNRKSRKTRKIPSSQAVNASVLSSYSVRETHTLHSASEPGITCMDLHPKPEMEKYIATGGVDSTIIVFNRDTKSIEHVLRGHRREIKSLQFHPDRPILLSSSADNTAIVWRFARGENKWKQASKIDNLHSNVVSSVSLHPIGSFFATSSMDGSWAFHSLAGVTLYQVPGEAGISALEIHPDGQLVGTCDTANLVKIWDLRTKQEAATLSGHQSRPNCLTFNQNGYSVATGENAGVVKIWDLRKLDKSHTTMDQFGDNRVCAVAFDPSGTYLGVGQPYGVDLFQCKKWERLASLRHHSQDVTDIRFGMNAALVVSCSRDRTLKVFGA